MASYLASHQHDYENDTSKSEMTQRLEVKKTSSAVGFKRTEGARVLKALAKLQHKLNRLQVSDKESGRGTGRSSPDLLTSPARSNGHYKTSVNEMLQTDFKDDDGSVGSDGSRYDHIEERLKLIEKQLQVIINNLPNKNCQQNGSAPDNKQTSVKQSGKFRLDFGTTFNVPPVNSKSYGDLRTSSKRDIHSTTEPLNGPNKWHSLDHMILDDTVDLIHYHYPKRNGNSVFTDKTRRGCEERVKQDQMSIGKVSSCRHYRLQLKDVPFLLGTSKNSFSAIANMQNQIAKLKRHSYLCHQMSECQKVQHKRSVEALDGEMKQLLCDLAEEHNFISEEIQYLAKRFPTTFDVERKQQIQRELYFLSRKLLNKQKQIIEIQNLYSELDQHLR